MEILRTHEDIEAQIRDIQSKRKEIPVGTENGVGLGESGVFDSEIYDGQDKKYEGYVTSIAANDDVDEDEEDVGYTAQKRTGLGAPVALLNDIAQGLFHPARKVRDVYWKIYNSLYIGGQDALVAGYPRIANDPKNQYTRFELDYIL